MDSLGPSYVPLVTRFNEPTYSKKGKVLPVTCFEGPDGGGIRSIAVLSNFSSEGGWLTARLGRCTRNNDPVPVVQEAE